MRNIHVAEREILDALVSRQRAEYNFHFVWARTALVKYELTNVAIAIVEQLGYQIGLGLCEEYLVQLEPFKRHLPSVEFDVLDQLLQVLLSGRVVVDSQLLHVMQELKAFRHERVLQLDGVEATISRKLHPKLLPPVSVHTLNAILDPNDRAVTNTSGAVSLALSLAVLLTVHQI